MLVAVAQLCSTPFVQRNLITCRRLIERASKAGAKLVYLPESSDFIAPTWEVLSLTLPMQPNPFVDGIREQAKQSAVWVGVGIHERPIGASVEDRIHNTQLLIDPEGHIKGKYDKLHLFDVDLKNSGGTTVLESKTTKPGTSLVAPISTPMGKVGLLTCYDLRFPEASLLLRERGADILTFPSAFTVKTGQSHWETLLRARAIETQSYVLAPAQIGEHFQGRASYGRAMVIDPWGSILAECPDEATSEEDSSTFGIADIDLEWLARVRREMPLWQQRRHDIYELNEAPST